MRRFVLLFAFMCLVAGTTVAAEHAKVNSTEAGVDSVADAPFPRVAMDQSRPARLAGEPAALADELFGICRCKRKCTTDAPYQCSLTVDAARKCKIQDWGYPCETCETDCGL